MVITPTSRPEAFVESAFAACPNSWFYAGSLRELRRPQRYELPGHAPLVAYSTGDGQASVLAAKCSHMGADLSGGCVRNGRITCPLHGWEYDHNGICRHIPVAEREPIPSFARQPAFPVAIRGGHVFFANTATPRFPAPFFETATPEELRAAAAFDLRDDVPWYFVGANGFDVQHFRNAHDRTLLEEPVVDFPDPFARRISLRLGVSGHSLSDRLTRSLAGPEVRMTVTVWGGTLIFVTARFRRTTTYGLLTVRPVPPLATHARVIVWVRRSTSPLAQRLADPVNTSVRRWFIRRFLQSDLGLLAGARYMPGRLIEADKYFRDYMEWLQRIHR